MSLVELFPFLGPAAGLVVGLYIGYMLHRRFVSSAIADGDQAHQQAIATLRDLSGDAVAIHRRISEDLTAEFAAYRARIEVEREAAAKREGRLEERLVAMGRRLDECRDGERGLLTRVAVLEAAQPARLAVVETLTRNDIKEK